MDRRAALPTRAPQPAISLVQRTGVHLERRGPGAGRRRSGGANQRGLTQASDAAGDPAGRPIRAVYASDLRRALRAPPPPSPPCSGCRSSPTHQLQSDRLRRARGLTLSDDQCVHHQPEEPAGSPIRTHARERRVHARPAGEPPVDRPARGHVDDDVTRDLVLSVAHRGARAGRRSMPTRHPGRSDQIRSSLERHRHAVPGFRAGLQGYPRAALRLARPSAAVIPPIPQFHHSEGGN